MSSSLTLERTTVHISDDTGRIAMLESRTTGTDAAPATLQRYIYSNHLQSAGLELDENANIISYEEYHPYGTTAYQASNSSINALAKRYRYTGKERDEETGLYYHGARYYIPWLGRWTASDPLEAKYAPLCTYNYCENNPVMLVDPSGQGGKEPGKLDNSMFKANVGSAADNARVNTTPTPPPVPATQQPPSLLIGKDLTKGTVHYDKDNTISPPPIDRTKVKRPRYQGPEFNPVYREKTPQEQAVSDAKKIEYYRANGYKDDGSPSFLMELSRNKTVAGLSQNIVEPMMDMAAIADGAVLLKGGLKYGVKNFVKNEIVNNSDNLILSSTSEGNFFGITATNEGTAYRAIHPDFAESTVLNGFYRSGAAGRLGNDGIYANNTVEGAIAEFQYHNPDVVPAVFEVKYPLSNPLQINPPSGYFAQPLPFTQGANILVAPSVRAVETTNLLIRQGARVGSRIQ